MKNLPKAIIAMMMVYASVPHRASGPGEEVPEALGGAQRMSTDGTPVTVSHTFVSREILSRGGSHIEPLPANALQIKLLPYQQVRGVPSKFNIHFIDVDGSPMNDIGDNREEKF